MTEYEQQLNFVSSIYVQMELRSKISMGGHFDQINTEKRLRDIYKEFPGYTHIAENYSETPVTQSYHKVLLNETQGMSVCITIRNEIFTRIVDNYGREIRIGDLLVDPETFGETFTEDDCVRVTHKFCQDGIICIRGTEEYILNNETAKRYHVL